MAIAPLVVVASPKIASLDKDTLLEVMGKWIETYARSDWQPKKMDQLLKSIVGDYKQVVVRSPKSAAIVFKDGKTLYVHTGLRKVEYLT